GVKIVYKKLCIYFRIFLSRNAKKIPTNRAANKPPALGENSLSTKGNKIDLSYTTVNKGI
ncbi:hypothetical protein ACJBXN_10765, partial [Streptococcus suis]